MLGRHSRLLCVAVLLVALQPGIRQAASATPEPYDPWPGLVQDIFSNRTINDGAGVIAIEMPYRAEDAAIVPVTLRATLPPGDARRVLRAANKVNITHRAVYSHSISENAAVALRAL